VTLQCTRPGAETTTWRQAAGVDTAPKYLPRWIQLVATPTTQVARCVYAAHCPRCDDASRAHAPARPPQSLVAGADELRHLLQHPGSDAEDARHLRRPGSPSCLPCNSKCRAGCMSHTRSTRRRRCCRSASPRRCALQPPTHCRPATSCPPTPPRTASSRHVHHSTGTRWLCQTSKVRQHPQGQSSAAPPRPAPGEQLLAHHLMGMSRNVMSGSA
jgi:hypothetical protein